MKHLLWIVILITFVATACATLAPPTSTSDPIEEYLDGYGGEPEVYQRIFALTDCTKLEEEYNQASRDFNEQENLWLLGYMGATLDRGREIGCLE